MKRFSCFNGSLRLLDDEGNPMPFDKLEGEFVLVPIELDSCLPKVRPGEPIFVLRGQDASAPMTIRGWAARNVRTSPTAKVDEAIADAEKMYAWQRANSKLVKYPD